MRAADAILEAAADALATLDGLAVFDAPPLQAVFPYATLAAGAESDWGHKSGAGRELRLAATIRDRGERPIRLRSLAGEAEAVLQALPADMAGWRLVTLALVRAQVAPQGKGGWAATIEMRARMLATVS
jgi:hypothetical protein